MTEEERKWKRDYLRKWEKYAAKYMETKVMQLCKTCGLPTCKLSILADAKSKVNLVTQKARGVQVLCASSWYTTPVTEFVTSEGEIEEKFRKVREYGADVFARPCPVTPRHGFVESRPIKTAVDAKEVFQEARKVDPQAELMLCQAIPAVANAIITPNAASIGPGHDGATSGKSSETLGIAALTFPKIDLANAGITETPFVEVVYDSAYASWFTQIRNGPAVSGMQTDFIPRKVKVKEVWEVKPGEDLLAFESKIAKASEGVVIYHPGGSLISHYAVHGVMKGIPVFISRKPNVGENLEPPKDQKELKYDPRAFKRGIEDGLSDELVPYTRSMNVILFAAHHASVLSNEIGSWAIGYAAAAMFRFGIAAAYGELRHSRSKPSQVGRVGLQGKNRAQIYEKILGGSIPNYGNPGTAFENFANEQWSHGYGGPNWAICTLSIIRLDGAMRRAYRRGSQGDIATTIAMLHNAVNCAHNGGWWMNKFVEKETFDQHAVGDLRAVATAVFAIWNIRQRIAKNKKFRDPAENSIANWQQKKAARFKLPKPIGAIRVHARMVTKADFGKLIEVRITAQDLDTEIFTWDADEEWGQVKEMCRNPLGDNFKRVIMEKVPPFLKKRIRASQAFSRGELNNAIELLRKRAKRAEEQAQLAILDAIDNDEEPCTCRKCKRME